MAPSADTTVQKKSQRPVLPLTLAHAHAFAPVTTPGGPITSGSYFPLPAPPAPLRSFTLPQNGVQDRDAAEPSTAYRTGSSTRQTVDEGTRENKGRARSASNKLDSVSSKSSKYRQSWSSASGGHRFEFASAAPFSAASPRLSSSSSVSGRSALSIAEIDCFFVHGSRSSVYSAQSKSSSLSREPSESGGSSAPLSELAITNEETASSDQWTSDEAERERQRAERRAFMKTRQAMREDARRSRKRVEPSPQSTAIWRDEVQARAQAQATLTLKNSPKVWERRRTTETAGSISSAPAAVAIDTTAPIGQPTLTDAIGKQPVSPSGPGPPSNATLLVDTLTVNLGRMTLSESANQVEQSVCLDHDPPSLSRFNSDETEVGVPLPTHT